VDFTTSSILSTSPRTGEEVNQRVKQSEVIVTDKCIIKIAGSGVAEVTSVYEGVDVQELRKLTERIGISFPEGTEMIQEPSNEEIELLKGMDPSGAYLR
jgi:acyl CoA:acetate/3-ketoacid CoA transferase beta subunit